jgi:predicted lipid-binding transport protein (Tim44 family)
MSRWRWLAILLLTGVIALAPALAEARAGGGTSQGSRGSRTYEGNSARPMERSVTPSQPSSPSATPRPSTPLGAPSPAMAPSFAQRHPFLTGIAGGFLGAGLAGMIFGHSAWAADGMGFGGGLGLLLQLLVIGGLIYLAVRLFRSRNAQPAEAMPGGGYTRSLGAMAAPTSRRDPVEIPVTEADYNAWSQLLAGIQDAWSKGEILRLKRYMTPEMVAYFNEQLAANASRGVENKVEHVQLLKGDVEEAWAEDGFEYVTARLRWSARDYTVRADGGQVVEGDPQRPVEATEVWTFVRSRGGNWLLSAIQQV